MLTTTSTTPVLLTRVRNGIEEPYDAFTHGWTVVRFFAIHGLTKLTGAIQLVASEPLQQVYLETPSGQLAEVLLTYDMKVIWAYRFSCTAAEPVPISDRAIAS